MTTEAVRVLVVDDHPTFRSGLSAVLSADRDVQVVAEAASGEEAVQSVQDVGPDVVLMDLAMPGIGGVEATRVISRRADAPRVLVLTMSDADTTVFAALRAGAHGYLLKDAAPDEIVRAVHDVAAGKAVFGAGVAARVLAYFATGAAAARPFPELSEREREVLELIARGRDNATIATTLHLSQKTVRNHVSAVIGKLHVSDRAEAIILARESGFGRGPQ